IGDADGGHVARGQILVLQHLLRHVDLAAPDVLRVMLYPARPRIDLLELLVALRDDVPAVIEDDGPRAGCALIEGENELLLSHDSCSLAPRGTGARPGDT